MIKRLYFIGLLAALLSGFQTNLMGQAISEDEVNTLVGKINHIGVYGSFNIRFAEINHQHSLWDGGRLMIVFNRKLGIGLSGLSFNTQPKTDSILNGRYSLKSDIGGIMIEPIIASNKKVHLTLPITIGYGRVSYSNDNEGYGNKLIEATDNFWVLEPGAEIEMNFFKFFRIGIGAYYRFVPPAQLRYRVSQKSIVDGGFLKGISFGASLKFGRF